MLEKCKRNILYEDTLWHRDHTLLFNRWNMSKSISHSVLAIHQLRLNDWNFKVGIFCSISKLEPWVFAASVRVLVLSWTHSFGPDHMWYFISRFPKIGVAPVIIHFDGISSYKPSSYGCSPMTMETPILVGLRPANVDSLIRGELSNKEIFRKFTEARGFPKVLSGIQTSSSDHSDVVMFWIGCDC